MNITAELGEACRNLSKMGTLSYNADYLRELSASLSPSDAAEVHRYFNTESGRFETEWRDEFLSYFPQAAGQIPEIDDAEFWQERLFALIQCGNLSAVQKFIAQIGTADQKFDPAKVYQECVSMGLGESLSDVPFDFYPIEGGDENGICAVDLARELGHEDIAAYLEALIIELDSRYLAAYSQGHSVE
jgi:hypothetical protein